MQHTIGRKDIRPDNDSIIYLRLSRPKARQCQWGSIQRFDPLSSKIFLQIHTRRDDIIRQNIDEFIHGDVGGQPRRSESNAEQRGISGARDQLKDRL